MTTARRPNILWVSFEDTSPLFPCYGDRTARTPNIDRLAAGGCIFRNTFSTAGVCAPARAAIITGMYPISVGTHHMRTSHTHPAELPTPYDAVLPHYVKCFPEYLRAAGYYTTNCQKTDYQFEPPRTVFNDRSATAHWRNRPDPAQPFFAIWNLDQTHESGMWPEKMPTAALTVDPARVPVPPYLPDTPVVREAIARMYTNIEHNDKRLGDLLNQLDADGLTDNTVVFLWSDHGPMPRGKRWPYDSGIHVPMIVRWPGHLQPGTADPRLISTIDLGPTVLSIAGLPVPLHLQGQPFLNAPAAAEREFVFASRDRYDQSYDMVRAARDKRFKYIRHYHPELNYLLWVPYRNRHPIMQEMWRLHLAGQLTEAQSQLFQKRPLEELYDTQSDPYELHNLAADPGHAPDLTRLRAAVDGWIDKVGDFGRMDEAEMVRRWYPDGKQPETAQVLFIPISAQNYGTMESTGGRLPAPAIVQLYCATQGASIAYTFDPPTAAETATADTARWQVYTEPIRLPIGATTIRAQAHRIGYLPGPETSATFDLT